MAASEVLEIIIKGRDQAGAALQKVNKGLKNMRLSAVSTNKVMIGLNKGIGGITRSIFSLQGAIATLGIGLLARSFLSAATTAESYRTRLVTLMGSMEKANELFDAMGDYASSVSFEYEEIMGAATNLSGIMTGGTEEIKKWMPIIADLAATAGMGIQETTSQVIRMYSAGAASADMFRERGILAMLGFQSGVSVSAAATRKQLIAAYEDPASKIRGAAAALSKTWSGMMSMMSDAWFQFRNVVMEAGVFDFIKAGISLLLEQIRLLKEEGKMEAFGKSLGKSVLGVLENIIKGVAIVADGFRGWKMIWLGLKATFALFSEFVNLGLASIYNGIDAMVQAIGRGIQNVAKMIEILDMTGLSKGLTESLRSTGELLAGMKGVGEEAEKRAAYWSKIGMETAKTLQNTISQESALTKVNRILGMIKKRAAEYAAEAGKAAKVRPPKVELKPQAKLQAMMKSELMRLNELIKTNLAELESSYKAGLIKLGEYYDKRRDFLEKSYAAEMELLKKAEAKQEDPTKRLAIQDRIFKREQQYTRDLMKLTDDRTKAEADQAKKRVAIAQQLAQIKGRVEFDSATNISNIFRNQQAELDKRQSDEVQKLRDMKAEEAQIEEAHRLHQLERDKQLADQRKQVQQIIIDNMKSSLGFMESAFADAYSASGNTVKEFFVAQKAASVANTIISAYEAAQKAYASLAGIPFVGPALGVAAAAAAIMAGLARVSAIRAQSLAAGGSVAGKSPTKTADNVPIMATAGEFMQPVDTVKHYGTKAMEAIRRKLVPKELFRSFSPASFTPNYSYAMAAGGSVPPGANGKGTTEINMTNITDPRDIDRYLASARGQDAVVNIISSRALSVKRVLRMQ